MISPGQLFYFLAALQDLMMGSVLLKCAAADLGLQWGGWALAAALRTEKFYDLAGNPLETPEAACWSLKSVLACHCVDVHVVPAHSALGVYPAR